MKELVDLEYVTVMYGRNGSAYRYRLAGDSPDADSRPVPPAFRDPAAMRRPEDTAQAGLSPDDT